MSNIFVWMVTRSEMTEQSDVNILHWRCEMFGEAGKASESVGQFTLATPIPFANFVEITPDEMRELIFANVDQSAVEDALVAQGA